MKNSALNSRKQKKHLRWILLLFFLTLSLPVYYLLQTVYSQLENEAYFTARHQAETLVDQIELSLKQLLETEQNRPIAEYQFFNVMTNLLLSKSSGVKFSPLSEMPPKTDIKGVIGFFQINTDGSFHLPVLPEIGQDNLSGLSLAELDSRMKLKQKIRSLLSIKVANKTERKKDKLSEALQTKTKAETAVIDQPYVEEFKQQSLSMADDMASSIELGKTKKQSPVKLNKRASSSLTVSKKRLSKSANKYKTRKETVQLPDQAMASSYFNRSQQLVAPVAPEQEQQQLILNDRTPPSPSASLINVLSFESEVTPLQLLLIGQDYFCFYRYVWHDNNRYTQGFIVKSEVFLEAITSPLVKASPFSRLMFSNNNALLQNIKISTTEQEFKLYTRHLAMPFQKLEMFVYAPRLAKVPGSILIDLLALSLFFIFLISFFVFYRLGSKQIDLARQQQNFISAVSHELKTPLTSIRMYSEMLRSGWVADATKKQNYYDFIFFESERLSRLIANVLQLARFGRQQHQPEIINSSAQDLLNRIAPKVEAQIEATDFKFTIIQAAEISPALNLKVDEDAFLQIMINLVDNAIKFSNKAEIKQIDIGFKFAQNHKNIIFFIRDYGPGIKKNQLKKIFTLFYRPENELTRTTPGTGIGLALVMQLAESMQASCRVINKQPGAEFQIKFLIK